MPFALLHNPNSGRGQGRLIAERLRHALRAADLPTRLFSIAQPPTVADLRDAAALFILGGDGTVHHTLALAAESRIPIYHLPLGTENLFAREFGMTRDIERAVHAAREGRTRAVDLAWLAPPPGGRGLGRGLPSPPNHQHASNSPPIPAIPLTALPRTPFALMLSLGPDARVIRRLAAARSGPITHFSYLRPILAELTRAAPSPITIEVDGQRLVDSQPGMVVVANSRQYALRLNPAANADMSDGLLDVAFLPARSTAALLPHLIAARLGRLHQRAGVLHACGTHVFLSSPDPDAAFQVDGELGRLPVSPAPAVNASNAALDLSITLTPGALRVLLPR